jgi:hypothetical protein
MDGLCIGHRKKPNGDFAMTQYINRTIETERLNEDGDWDVVETEVEFAVWIECGYVVVSVSDYDDNELNEDQLRAADDMLDSIRAEGCWL